MQPVKINQEILLAELESAYEIINEQQKVIKNLNKKIEDLEECNDYNEALISNLSLKAMLLQQKNGVDTSKYICDYVKESHECVYGTSIDEETKIKKPKCLICGKTPSFPINK